MSHLKWFIGVVATALGTWRTCVAIDNTPVNSAEHNFFIALAIVLGILTIIQLVQTGIKVTEV